MRPTEARNAINITGVIESKQGRVVMKNDVPNAFAQTTAPQEKGDKIIIINIWGALIDILCEISPEIYELYVRFDKNIREKVLYVRMLKALY